MRRAPSTQRAAALIGAAALCLHELRFLGGYGRHADEALSEQGHAYLPFAGALAAGMLALAAGRLARALLRARRSGAAEAEPPPLLVAWAGASAALLVIYGSQELLEGVLSAGHPEGIAGVLGHGGWVAAPLAVGLGALVALLLRGAGAALAAAARTARRGPLPRAPLRASRPRPRAVGPRSPVLARKLAGRAPPLAA
jgi:hypothetical protein